MRYIHSEEILEVPENGTCCSIAAILTSSFPRPRDQTATDDRLLEEMHTRLAGQPAGWKGFSTAHCGFAGAGISSSLGFRQIEARLLTLFATA
jgi:hypothetical protein